MQFLFLHFRQMISWLGTASVTPHTLMATQITSYKNGY